MVLILRSRAKRGVSKDECQMLRDARSALLSHEAEKIVMPGLDPGIHRNKSGGRKPAVFVLVSIL
jgi:hypothetical protein